MRPRHGGALPQPAAHGAAPVARLDAMPRPHALAVRLLRGWCGQARERLAIEAAFAAGLGAVGGRDAVGDLDALVRLVAREGRRPLWLHAPCCPCAGADEAAFAALLSAAAEQADEDAALIAALLLPAARVAEATDLARRAGRAIGWLCATPRVPSGMQAAPAPPGRARRLH